MSPLDRLLLELVPTRPAPAVPGGIWSEAQQDEHWALLCESVGTPGAPRPPRPTEQQTAA
jgi:hypothetical protein